MSVASQMSRVKEGKIELNDLDFYYIHYHSGRSGHLALATIKREYASLDADLLEKINNPTRHGMGVNTDTIDVFCENISYRPQYFVLPPAVVKLINQSSPSFMPVGPTGVEQEAILMETDLNANEKWEYALIRLFDRGDGLQDIFQASYYYEIEDQLHDGMLIHSAGRPSFISLMGYSQSVSASNGNSIDTAKNSKTSKIEIQKPLFNNLKVGEVLLRPH